MMVTDLAFQRRAAVSMQGSLRVPVKNRGDVVYSVMDRLQYSQPAWDNCIGAVEGGVRVMVGRAAPASAQSAKCQAPNSSCFRENTAPSSIIRHPPSHDPFQLIVSSVPPHLRSHLPSIQTWLASFTQCRLSTQSCRPFHMQ
ncbi:hypothetical protein EJ04DRAFT_58761 [Polyplosphaeria fusca]|uniref:Uncharacterized protein n=1 Tax=Polyplosphaeria fusca TaxID=682080 RepID=A0A9P4QS27_9PLEO|nr:hypothetical protein EJ04DRAFT_58761 [Polyplosphaeria fusca]